MATVAGIPDGQASATFAATLRRGGLGLLGAVSGAAAGLNWLAHQDGMRLTRLDAAGAAVGGAAIALLAIAGIEIAAGRLARGMSRPARRRLARFDLLAFLPLLLTVPGAWGLWVPPLPVLLLAVAALKAMLVLGELSADRREEVLSSLGWLAFLFLISGFAALIYQIVWQRTLFAAYGVNIESITIIVSLFMLGLGLGALVGGLLSKRFPRRAPLLFLYCETGIGLFGIVSLPLIGRVSALTLHASLPAVSLAIFALLFVPTLLMGATLPILVAHLHRYYRNVGRSVGLLYAINTIGSAIACFLTADLLFVLTGQQGAVVVAALCNLAVGVLVWRYARRIGRAGPADSDGAPLAPPAEPPAAVGAPLHSSDRLHRLWALLFAAAVGYVSLSQEIVWMRVVSYMTGGKPTVFAHVLGFFLVGVALGALYAKRMCERRFIAGASPMRFVGGLLVTAAAVYYLSITATAGLNRLSNPLGLAVTHVLVAVISFLLGGVFPILCHYGTRAGQSVGVSVSHLYLANIVGSTLGPLLTGFVLMEYFGIGRIILGLSVATLLLGVTASVLARRRGAWRPLVAGAAVAAAFVFHPTLYARLYERLHAGGDRPPYKHLVETRSGVVAIESAKDGDVIFGGGVYDGRMNTDPVVNSNMIRRCYMIAALHPQPADVLEIGLSGGAWATVLTRYRPLRCLTVVEINPGYLDVIREYPEQHPLLNDPKVKIDIDDGRRWLNRHPDAKFDLIVQNTTFHWRSHASSLLSREYLRLCRRRLKPGGVMYYNTTYSSYVPYTAARVFKHVVRYRNFIACSDRPFDLTPPQVRANLLEFAAGGRPVFDRPRARPVLEQLVATRLVDVAPRLREQPGQQIITDDNMATEFKRRLWASREVSWRAMFSRCRR